MDESGNPKIWCRYTKRKKTNKYLGNSQANIEAVENKDKTRNDLEDTQEGIEKVLKEGGYFS